MASSTDNDSGNIDLMGWDTVFALRLDALNASIAAQHTSPATFDGLDPSGGAEVKGDWGDFSVGVDQNNVTLMNCPVVSGTLTVPGMDDTDLAGCTVVCEIRLQTSPAEDQLDDPTATDGSGHTVNFTADTADLVVRSVEGLEGMAVYAANAAFEAYFAANPGIFDAVFAAVRLEEEAIEAGKQWLKPVVSSYAVATTGDPDSSAFALLNMTSQPSGPLPQNNFDIRMFDVFDGTEKATNSVFAISAPLTMQNIVMQAAKSCVMGATDDDFEIVNNGITVANKNTLNWGNFQLTEDDPDSIVVPVIQPGDFQLTLDGMSFHLSISQAAFTTPDGTADVKLTADQYFNIDAAQLSDGYYYLVPSPGLGTNSIRADVTPNKGFEIAMIITSIAAGITFAFLGGALGEALGDAVSSGVEGAEGFVEAGAEDLDSGIDSFSEDELSEAENQSEEEAESSIASEGESSNTGKTGIFSNKYKIWGGVLGSMLGIPISVLPQVMQMVWQDNITEGNVPTIDDFATNFAAAIQWPYVESWQVTGGTFRAAFLLGGSAE